MSLLTNNAVPDEKAVANMTPAFPRTMKRGYGDGAYDKNSCYRIFQERGAHLIVPPQKGAVLHNLTQRPWLHHRNGAIRAIIGLGNDAEARSIWKKLARYHRRSLIETAMYRFKMLFGSHLSARELHRQRAEVYAKSIAMNRMTRLGLPKGIWSG